MPTFIAITAKKGGVAKTTSAVSLAHHLARQKATTLLIDFDPQGHAATALGLDPMPGIFDLFIVEKPLANCLQSTTRIIEQEDAEPVTLERPGLTLLPGNQRTTLASSTLYMQLSSGELTRPQLLKMLHTISQGFDYVVMDTPATGVFQELALEVADSIVIPTELEQLSMTGVASTMATIAKLNPSARVIVLPTMYDMRIGEHRYNLNLLQEAYPSAISEPVMNSSVVKEATAAGQTVWEYTSKNKSATLGRVRFAYSRLAEWVRQSPPF